MTHDSNVSQRNSKHRRSAAFGRRLLSTGLLLAALVATPSVAATVGTATPGSLQPGEAQDLIEKGQEQLDLERPLRAARSFRKAVEASGETSVEAWLGLAKASLLAERFEQALDAAQGAEGLPTAAVDLLTVRQVQGTAHFELRKKGGEHLERAERALRHALDLAAELGDTSGTPRYSLALVLEAGGRHDEALAEVRQFPFASAEDQMATAARTLLCRTKASLGWQALSGEVYDPASEGVVSPRFVGHTTSQVRRVPAPYDLRGEAGQVTAHLELLLDGEGCTRSVAMVEGPEEYEQPLIEFYEHSVYQPATRGGQGVPYRTSLIYRVSTSVNSVPKIVPVRSSPNRSW